MNITLTLTHLHFNAVAHEPVRLNQRMAGHYLRNAMASVMRRATCTETHRTGRPTPEHAAVCPACWLLAANEEPGHVVRAYGMVPPLPPRKQVEPGETFSFALSLYGDGTRFLPYFVLALSEVGRIGIGPGRGSFAVKTITAVNPLARETQAVLRREETVVTVPSLAVTWAEVETEAATLAEETASGELAINFLTPARLTDQKRLVKVPDFGVFFQRLLRRIDDLRQQFAGESSRPWEEIAALHDLANRVRLVQTDTRWVEVRGYSGRTKKKRWFSGLVGRATYRSEVWAPLLPWLVLGQGVQVGKDTVRGNGVYTIECQGNPGYWSWLRKSPA